MKYEKHFFFVENTQNRPLYFLFCIQNNSVKMVAESSLLFGIRFYWNYMSYKNVSYL